MIKKIFAAAALSLLASSSFAAAPTAFYAGLDLGATKIDMLSDSQASYGGFLGYGFNRFVAVELGYRQLGKWNVSGIDVDINQTHLSVVGSFPLNRRLDIFGRVGYNTVHVDGSYRGYSAGADANGGLYGVGLNLNFTPAVFGRVEVQKPASDTTNLGVSVIFKF